MAPHRVLRVWAGTHSQDPWVLGLRVENDKTTCAKLLIYYLNIIRQDTWPLPSWESRYSQLGGVLRPPWGLSSLVRAAAPSSIVVVSLFKLPSCLNTLSGPIPTASVLFTLWFRITSLAVLGEGQGSLVAGSFLALVLVSQDDMDLLWAAISGWSNILVLSNLPHCPFPSQVKPLPLDLGLVEPLDLAGLGWAGTLGWTMGPWQACPAPPSSSQTTSHHLGWSSDRTSSFPWSKDSDPTLPPPPWSRSSDPWFPLGPRAALFVVPLFQLEDVIFYF